jgi:hypothetical protein
MLGEWGEMGVRWDCECWGVGFWSFIELGMRDCEDTGCR